MTLESTKLRQKRNYADKQHGKRNKNNDERQNISNNSKSNKLKAKRLSLFTLLRHITVKRNLLIAAVSKRRTIYLSAKQVDFCAAQCTPPDHGTRPVVLFKSLAIICFIFSLAICFRIYF